MTDEENQVDPLDHFVQLFNTPSGQAVAQEATRRIADYHARRQIADENSAVGEAFTANLAEMRSNFVSMVRDDPTSVHLALDLAPLGVHGMVSSVPDATMDQGQEITTGVQRDIAYTAVHSLAEKDDTLAHNLLRDERVSKLLGDQVEPLSGYITAQATARKIDAQGWQREVAKAAVRQAEGGAVDYMSALVDPDTGEVGYTPGWAERLMADQTLPPHMKAGLFDTYGRLAENGDVATSDPDVARDLVRGIHSGGVPPMQILARAGDDLRAVDAIYLSHLAADPLLRRRAGEISAALDAAQRTLAAPENGLAGQAAAQKFSSWLLGAARDGADLNPTSKEYVLQGDRLQQFAPRAADLVDYAAQAPEQRRPLGDIFGERKSV